MKCPDQIAQVLLEIIHQAVLRMRQEGELGNATFCALEADHIHHLPRLLSNYRREELNWYWEVMRPYYTRKAPEDAKFYTGLWQQLANAVGDLATDEQIAREEQEMVAVVRARRLNVNDPN